MGFLAAAAAGLTLGATGNVDAKSASALLTASLCLTTLHIVSKGTVYQLFLQRMGMPPSAGLTLLFAAVSLACNTAIAGLCVGAGALARSAWLLAQT